MSMSYKIKNKIRTNKGPIIISQGPTTSGPTTKDKMFVKRRTIAGNPKQGDIAIESVV